MDFQGMISRFRIEGSIVKAEEYGNGHINRTYLVETDRKKYIFQKINTAIFQNVESLMENISGVTSYLTQTIRQRGGDVDRETLQLIPTVEGERFYRDEEGTCWRMYLFITEATSFDAVDKPEDFYASAVAFGDFQSLLAGYPAQTLHETIPDFHHTPKRYQAFCRAVEKDSCGRIVSGRRSVLSWRDSRKCPC